MPKCARCGKSGPFLPVGKSGLCIDCLEEANEIAIKTIQMLRKGGDDRKKALDAIDAVAAADVAQQAEADLEKSAFSYWDTSVHSSPEQLARIRRSTSVTILSYDPETGIATCKGSGKNPYTTSFLTCSCGDFIARRQPCKHMYKLAALHGGVDFSAYLD